MHSPSRPIRVRSEIAADMADDVGELRALKQLQARIFQQLKVEKQQEEAEQAQRDAESLIGLTRVLLNLAHQLRAERDALQAQLDDENRIANLRRMADEIMRFATGRDLSADVAESAPQERPAPWARQPAHSGRRPLNSSAAHGPRLDAYAARPERMAWALRS